MPPTKRESWAAARPTAAPYRNITKKASGGGQSLRPILTLPMWTPRNVALNAMQGGIEASMGDMLFGRILAEWPDALKYRLVQTLLTVEDRGDNKFLQQHMAEMTDLRDALEEDYKLAIERKEIEADPYRHLIPRMVAVLAAHLGAYKGVGDPCTLISDGTLLGSATLVAPENRILPELCALRASRPIINDKGAVTCWCGKNMLFRTKRAWKGNGPPTEYFVCPTGNCRLEITSSALQTLKDLMEEMQVSHIPEWFCPLHPDKEIKITDGETEGEGSTRFLRVRCSWYSGDQRTRQFCCSEIAGPMGEPHLATGEIMWKALDLLTFD
jgi:hypothetical protein